MSSKVFSALFFCALAVAPRMSATEIVTTSFSTWAATTSNYAEWTFSPPPGNGSYSNSTGYSLNTSATYGTTVVTGPDGAGYSLAGTSAYGSGGNQMALQGASDGIGSMLFTPSGAGLTAFALYLGISSSAAPITVTLSDGETFTASPAVNGYTMLGLSSATPITSFSLSTTAGSQVDLTDFFAGTSNQTDSTPAPTAEVTTALMIGTGLLAFGARRKVFSNLTRSQNLVTKC